MNNSRFTHRPGQHWEEAAAPNTTRLELVAGAVGWPAVASFAYPVGSGAGGINKMLFMAVIASNYNHLLNVETGLECESY